MDTRVAALLRVHRHSEGARQALPWTRSATASAATACVGRRRCPSYPSAQILIFSFRESLSGADADGIFPLLCYAGVRRLGVVAIQRNGRPAQEASQPSLCLNQSEERCSERPLNDGWWRPHSSNQTHGFSTASQSAENPVCRSDPRDGSEGGRYDVACSMPHASVEFTRGSSPLMFGARQWHKPRLAKKKKKRITSE